jgi:hypothetical protein
MPLFGRPRQNPNTKLIRNAAIGACWNVGPVLAMSTQRPFCGTKRRPKHDLTFVSEYCNYKPSRAAAFRTYFVFGFRRGRPKSDLIFVSEMTTTSRRTRLKFVSPDHNIPRVAAAWQPARPNRMPFTCLCVPKQQFVQRGPEHGRTTHIASLSERRSTGGHQAADFRMFE